MHISIDGQLVDSTDDFAVFAACQERAKRFVAEVPEANRAYELERMHACAGFAAYKFGALCAYVKAFPRQPLARGLLFEFADLFGALTQIEFGFTHPEHQVHALTEPQKESEPAASGIVAADGSAIKPGAVGGAGTPEHTRLDRNGDPVAERARGKAH